MSHVSPIQELDTEDRVILSSWWFCGQAGHLPTKVNRSTLFESGQISSKGVVTIDTVIID